MEPRIFACALFTLSLAPDWIPTHTWEFETTKVCTRGWGTKNAGGRTIFTFSYTDLIPKPYEGFKRLIACPRSTIVKHQAHWGIKRFRWVEGLTGEPRNHQWGTRWFKVILPNVQNLILFNKISLAMSCLLDDWSGNMNPGFTSGDGLIACPIRSV